MISCPFSLRKGNTTNLQPQVLPGAFFISSYPTNPSSTALRRTSSTNVFDSAQPTQQHSRGFDCPTVKQMVGQVFGIHLGPGIAVVSVEMGVVGEMHWLTSYSGFMKWWLY
jgi:hypothetical protein